MSFTPEMIGTKGRRFITPAQKKLAKWMKKKKERSLKRDLINRIKKSNYEYDGYTIQPRIRYRGWVL